jgi:hypothetical protein
MECPIPAREQREIELSLGAPPDNATPAEPGRRETLQIAVVYTTVAVTLAATHSVVPWPLLAVATVLFWCTAFDIRPSWRADLAALRSILIVLLALALGVVCVGWLGTQVRATPIWIVLAWIGGFVVLGRLQRAAARARDRRQHTMEVRLALTSRGRCPSCAHPLAGLERESDLCVVCAHCGGAWRIGDLPAAVNPETCPTCEYSLTGLPVGAESNLRCPECGQLVPMPGSRMGVMPEPIVGPNCRGCGTPLMGLPLVNGDRVRCPNCGQWRSGLTAADVATPSEPRA